MVSIDLCFDFLFSPPKGKKMKREKEKEKNKISIARFLDKGSARTSKNPALVSGAVAGTAAERNRRTKDK